VSTPKVTVAMAVYRPEFSRLQQSIDSLRNQTFTDWECVLVDDGNEMSVQRMLVDLVGSDLRFKIIKNRINMGLTSSLNRGICEARGEYVARQDDDDVSAPGRLAAQVNLLDSRPEVVLSGSNSKDIGPDGYVSEWGWYSEEELIRIVYLKNPIPHSSAVFRRDAAFSAGLYDESFDTSQDFEFWMRLADFGRLAMIPEPLITRYITPRSRSVRKRLRQGINALRARMRHPHFGRLAALWHSVRQVIIAFVPYRLIHALRKQLFY